MLLQWFKKVLSICVASTNIPFAALVSKGKTVMMLGCNHNIFHMNRGAILTHASDHILPD